MAPSDDSFQSFATTVNAMAKQPRITVLQLHPRNALGRMDDWLRQAGVRLSVVGLWEKDVPSLASIGDGLLVLDGPMTAADRAEHRWLDPLGDLIADAQSIEIPILGVGLGHQIVAHALGGRLPADQPAEAGAGSVDVIWLDAATSDPIVGALSASGAATLTVAGKDAIEDLPVGSTELARSTNQANLAFRLGGAWGLRFQPDALGDAERLVATAFADVVRG